MSSEQEIPLRTTPQTEGKQIAIISYLTFIGWIIAFLMHNNNRSAIGAYHLRQSLMLFVVAILYYCLQMILLFIPYIGWIMAILSSIVGIGLLILWVIGLMNAINGVKKPIPLIGEKANELFGSLG